MTGNEPVGTACGGASVFGAAGAGIADDMSLCFIDDLFTQQCAVCGTAYKRSVWRMLTDSGDGCPYCHARASSGLARGRVLS